MIQDSVPVPARVEVPRNYAFALAHLGVCEYWHSAIRRIRHLASRLLVFLEEIQSWSRGVGRE
jgi:hypothetical protein